uniref:Uncharacterized protein n=1 Tax=Cacopsylla melanoneura TaxID=428564 RepID=A0A8D8LCJ7_9HEMI
MSRNTSSLNIFWRSSILPWSNLNNGNFSSCFEFLTFLLFSLLAQSTDSMTSSFSHMCLSSLSHGSPLDVSFLSFTRVIRRIFSIAGNPSKGLIKPQTCFDPLRKDQSQVSSAYDVNNTSNK